MLGVHILLIDDVGYKHSTSGGAPLKSTFENDVNFGDFVPYGLQNTLILRVV